MVGYNKKTIEDLDISKKRVLVRCDFNVPMDSEGRITDDTRIRAALATIEYLINGNAIIILMAHLGRPKGKVATKYSLAPVARKIEELLNKEVIFVDDASVIGKETKKKARALKPRDIMLLQNLRFREEEEKNDEAFSKELASLGDIFVNDAFGTAHRAHSSTAGIAKYLPAVAGYLIQREVHFLGKTLENPEKPFVAILGGAKVSDKIGVIEKLIEKVDILLIGGGMAYTFLKAQGFEIGQSLLEEDKIGLASNLIKKAKDNEVELILPSDIVVGREFKADTHYKTVSYNKIPTNYMGLDIGEKTIREFSQKIKSAKTIIWNGPMGVFEMPRFAIGTKEIAQALAKNKGTTIIGGGDSAAAVEQLGFANRISHISTGGGAALEFLEGKTLPGISVLEENK